MLKTRLVWQPNKNFYKVEKLTSNEIKKLEETNILFRKLKEQYKRLFIVDDDEYKKIIIDYRRQYNAIKALYEELRINMNLDPYKV